jgi:lipid A 3-O-deacylase
VLIFIIRKNVLNILMRITFFLFLLLLCSCSKVSFNLENDVFGNTDNNFTNGVEIKVEADPQDIPKSIDDNFPSGRFFESDPKTVEKYVFGLRQDMYTPYSLKVKEVIPDQNPYAGSLTFDTAKISATEDVKVSTKLRVGTSGWPSLAGETQTFVHDTLTKWGRNQRHPEGWHNQISTQPLINFDWERTVEHFRIGEIVQLTSESSTLARFGNIHTDALAKIGVKYGYNLPRLNTDSVKEFSVWAGSSSFVDLVAHNLYFDGGIFRDSIHTVDSSPVVVGLENSVGISYGNYSLAFVYNVKTKDYEDQPQASHGYGLIAFGKQW